MNWSKCDSSNKLKHNIQKTNTVFGKLKIIYLTKSKLSLHSEIKTHKKFLNSYDAIRVKVVKY